MNDHVKTVTKKVINSNSIFGKIIRFEIFLLNFCLSFFLSNQLFLLFIRSLGNLSISKLHREDKNRVQFDLIFYNTILTLFPRMIIRYSNDTQ